MSNHVIGKIISVTSDRIQVLLEDYMDDGETKKGVPETMSLSIDNGDGGPCPILIGQPGSFVKVPISNFSLLCMVLDIHMLDRPITMADTKEIIDAGDYVVTSVKRVLSIIPIGKIFSNGNFERGCDVLPTVNSNVHAVLPKTIDKVFESFADGKFSFGRLSLLPEQRAKIDFDAFLGRHAAILGQTGGGKSWTVASILQKIKSEFKKSTVVLFDLHGEYKDTFGNSAEYIDASDLELPYWLMNSEELLGLMVDRSESAAPNQIAKFKGLLQAAKEEHTENKKLEISKITVDTPVYFDFDSIINEFRRLDTEMVPGVNKPKQGDLHGQFTRLIMRIDSRLNDKRYDLIFKPKKYNSSASMQELFRLLLGERINDDKKITVIDMSSIPFDVRTSVISLILRCLFDFSYWYRKQNEKIYPLSIFCDEAHLYLNDREGNCEPSRMSAERIAKEGRKYGISLVVISQRPREVSSTILSQAGTFICLRLSNPDDQSYVKNLLPDSIKSIVNMFATLRRGEAIITGDAVMMPTRITIDKPNPPPNSSDCSFSEEWSKEHEEVNIDTVLNAWRKQEVTKTVPKEI
jgi:uncharacterized protein